MLAGVRVGGRYAPASRGSAPRVGISKMSSPHLSRGTPTAKRVTRIATLAIVGIAYFCITVVALHFLRPDYDPIRRFMSEYAVGPYGVLMTSAFFGMSLGSLALVIGLYQGVPPPGRSIGLVLLGIWGVGVLFAGLFPSDLKGAPETRSGNIHNLVSLVGFLSVVPATILVSWRFKQDEKWHSFHGPALILALVMLSALIGFFLPAAAEFVGLSQRIFVGAVLTWLLLTAARLRSLATGSASTR